MSVHASAPLPFRPFPGTPPAAARSAPAPAAPAAPAETPAASAPAAAAPPAAPAESTLWSLLSDDERSFFSQQASLGALTYGRAGAATPDAPRTAGVPLGQRLDVRG